jgi:alpha-glucuronidase
MGSREAVVDYMTPLGLHHLMGPAITTARALGRRPGAPDWNPVYYAKARDGIGFDRTARAATPWPSTRPRGRRPLRRPEASTRRTCCGSTTCRGTTA